MISTIVIIGSNCVLVGGIPIGIEDVFIKEHKLIIPNIAICISNASLDILTSCISRVFSLMTVAFIELLTQAPSNDITDHNSLVYMI